MQRRSFAQPPMPPVAQDGPLRQGYRSLWEGFDEVAEVAAQLALRKAVISDVPKIQKLVNFHADKDEMLHRSLNDLYETIRDFYVIEENGEILACAAIHVTWD